MSFSSGVGFSIVAMAIVFIMLIALSLVIVFMGKVLGEKPAPKKEPAAEKVEEIQEEYVEEIPVVDDCEIVAVIMAALSASLNVPSDKLSIRSIKRTNNWRK